MRESNPKTMKNWMASIPFCTIVILFDMSDCIQAHEDEDSTKIGEYRVVLNSIKVLSFDDNGPLGIEEAAPDLFIKTFTQAETHVGQTAAFGEFTDTPVGNVVGIGKLIYWHLDCPDSEELQLIVDVGDRDDGGFAEVLAVALRVGQGILTTEQPQAAPAINAALQEILKAIDAELKADDQFPQFSSGGFTIDDNAGTLVKQSAVGGIGMTGQYEFSATFTYRERNQTCTAKHIFELQKKLVDFDSEVKVIKERLVNGPLESGKKVVQRAVKEGLDSGHPRLDYALAEGEVGDFLTQVKGSTVVVNLENNVDEIPAFYIIGAAAQAFRNLSEDTIRVEMPNSVYQANKAAVITFLDVSERKIGTGDFIHDLLQHITVQDVLAPVAPSFQGTATKKKSSSMKDGPKSQL
jgi:hypothetical protein